MLRQVCDGLRRRPLWPVTVLVMRADSSFWDSLVFGGIDELDVEAVTAAFGTVDVTARGRAAGAVCPGCGLFSDRVHDSYQRRLKDLPLGGKTVRARDLGLRLGRPGAWASSTTAATWERHEVRCRYLASAHSSTKAQSRRIRLR
ncbi:transposase family protein [Streptomyces sp. NPDC085927]|uniref:transposase family protein n=1 Tax=Streptomyces sp. NPDC085927 TaxID=3365738 RepID=UPI0037D6ACE0